MKNENEKGKMIYRLLGSILGGFCREIGVEKTREFVRFVADENSFWEILDAVAKNDSKSLIDSVSSQCQKKARENEQKKIERMETV